jgi:multiple sugar transport system permease protein
MTALNDRAVNRKRRGPKQGRDALSGWLLTLPMLVLIGLFVVVPVLMAFWVSVSDWTGRGSPLSSGVNYVGTDNYAELFSGQGLGARDFGTSLRNNAWYVFLVVPLQTILSLFLATLVSRQAMKARGFFRTAFYFPSVTSSVAITVLFLFLFSSSGVINKIISFLGGSGPNWFNDPRGILTIVWDKLGIDTATGALADARILGISGWDWLAGPSVAMCVFIIMAVFTTSGTFMLLFIAALQQISGEVEEAAIMDGASSWQRFTRVTVPMLKPTIFTVVTLGLIGTWQVFDQIYTGTQGGPAKTTLTPAYLSYTASFESQRWGRGAAIAFVLFAIIVLMTIIQRIVLADREDFKAKRRARKRARAQARESALLAAGAGTAPVVPNPGPDEPHETDDGRRS